MVYAEEILKVVDKIIDDGKCLFEEFIEFDSPKLDSFGIILENGEYIFKETQRELGKKSD